MRRFNFVCSIIITVVMPLMIVMLSINFTFRLTDTYMYYFNDSEILDEITYNIPEKDMASSISGYFNSFGSGEFQVFEDNGIYQDPIFDKADVAAMGKFRFLLNVSLGVSLLLLVVTIGIFTYFFRRGFKKALRDRYKIILGLSSGLLILQLLCFIIPSVRKSFYSAFVGIKLAKDSLLVQVIGGSFFGTYGLFCGVIGVVMIAVISYVVFSLTKPPRIFF